MKNIKLKNIFKKLIILTSLIYISYIFFSQQQSLNSYATSQEYYLEQIAKEKENNTTLTKMKDNINSEEYLEQMAREKLDMYLPNERIYIDIEK